MKKISLLVLICLMIMSINAQRCAVLEFKAGVGVSQSDVDGISAIFITYFRPAGYTMVERTQIDKVIEEQRFQRSNMTQSQMVRLGQILNVSKIVVGDINVVFGQYQVDARVINVETGTIAATEGATFATTSYRSSMQSVAQKLASKIAITPGSTIAPSSNTPKQRSSVEILWGYLKIFPKELGTFSSEPTNVISNINAQAQYGYNNWRIPTNEELSLLRANNYLGNGEYMTSEKRSGIVLLVTTGEDYATVQAKEEEKRIRAEQEEARRQDSIRKEHAKKQDSIDKVNAQIRAEQERKAQLKAQGFVDLGLPSGTLWKNQNEANYYTYSQAVKNFGDYLPNKKHIQELKKYCRWTWTGNGYKVTGPNEQYIILPSQGYYSAWGNQVEKEYGYYWSSTLENSEAVYLFFRKNNNGQNEIDISSSYILRDSSFSVRLIHEP